VAQGLDEAAEGGRIGARYGGKVAHRAGGGIEIVSDSEARCVLSAEQQIRTVYGGGGLMDRPKPWDKRYVGLQRPEQAHSVDPDALNATEKADFRCWVSAGEAGRERCPGSPVQRCQACWPWLRGPARQADPPLVADRNPGSPSRSHPFNRFEGTSSFRPRARRAGKGTCGTVRLTVGSVFSPTCRSWRSAHRRHQD
jgi:hypothetical protein